ncbi:hypothetical protein Q4557_04315 [Shewanella sp. 5_MG-2023]|uniref:hypothetical protein n=1 Tax=Shewanella sp. 5_MG-2023 TaxID=3062656 RepID=UPI0026E37770|nr:hypothetical protein [Shewanella sp. 5_MG-2023]MDO6639189.1 hypothetical protein [Shewanella sp. 5_MG-2023]
MPFGSEPDFLHRINKIVSGERSLSAEFLFYFYGGFDWNPTCAYTYSMSSITGNVDGFMCGETLEQKFIRWLLQVSYFIPFFIIVFKMYLLKNLGILKNNELEFRFVALFSSLTFPSLIYFTGVAAEEQITLFLSLFISVFIRNLFVTLLLLFLIFFVEIGTAMVVSLFLLNYFFYHFILKKASIKFIEILSLFLIVICFIFKMQLLTILFYLPIIGNKVMVIYNAYTLTSYADVVDKYPLLFRPLMTFISGVFMTPHGIKVILLYPIVFYFLIRLYLKSRRYAYDYNAKSGYVTLLLIFTFITCTVFVLPGYSNAKYYIFVLPFILQNAIAIYGFKPVVHFSIFCSIVVCIQLVLARM